jgi:hypothetical protein
MAENLQFIAAFKSGTITTVPPCGSDTVQGWMCMVDLQQDVTNEAWDMGREAGRWGRATAEGHTWNRPTTMSPGVQDHVTGSLMDR